MKMPEIGLGTWELRGQTCTDVVSLALSLGYRHIDTAHVYQTHTAVKKGIEGFDRTKLYITSKVELEAQVNPLRGKESVLEACQQALRELGTDYLDLYLIHSPIRTFPLDEVYRTIDSLVQSGKVRAAGVSNYNIHHLQDLKKAGFTPSCNQVEFHPYLNQKELLNYCRSHHIQLVSYRPFGKGKLLKEEPLFDKIGAHHKKTGGQVILRWLTQQQIPVIPKASSEKHLKENLNIFDFTLSHAEMAQLDTLHRNHRYCGAENTEHNY